MKATDCATAQIPRSPSVKVTSQIPEAMREFLARLPAVVYECGPPPDYATTFVSDNVEAQFGYKPEDFYSDPFFWTKRIHESDRPGILKKLGSIGNEDVITYEYRFLRSDGEYSWLNDQVSVLRGKQSRIMGLVGSWFDLSDRKRLEMLQAGQSLVLDFLIKRRSLEESLEQIVRMLETQNPEMACSILRYDASTQTLRHGAAPSLPEEYNRQIDGVSIGAAMGSCGTAAFRRTRVIVTDIQTDPLWVGFRPLAAGIHKRACWSQPIFSSTDQLLGTFAMYYENPRGPTKGDLALIEQAASLAAIAIERYHDEEIRRHTERLASLGTLAAGIAHEINNPLGAMQLAAQGALHAMTKGNTQRVQEMLEMILADSDRCARIVRGVLQFGKRQEGSTRRIGLSQIAGTACALTRGYAVERGASVTFSPANPDVEVEARVVELEQVLVNLIRNASESKEFGARVSIQVWGDADFAHVSVGDDGRGMTREQQSRVFEPFFTTRQAEGGTGLGMSIVHGIVTSHGGTVRIKSKPGMGTTVELCLPRHS